MRWDKDYVKWAAGKHMIIAGINIFGHEDAGAVIRAAERAEIPVLLMVNRDAKRELAIEHWGALLGSMAEKARVPVAVHLDHCSDPENVKRAINSGYTSVMFDGSKMPFEENVRITAELARAAHKQGVLIEGELGSVPYSDLGETVIKWTSSEEAKRMQESTELDWLAVSVGNIHRLVGRKAPIHFDVLEEIERECSLPLVIHGSSGISREDIQKLREKRVGKMNFGTSLRKVFGDTLRQEVINKPDVFDRQKLMKSSVEMVEEAAYEILKELRDYKDVQ